VSSCDRPEAKTGSPAQLRENGEEFDNPVMSLTQAEVLIALVVAAHAGVLAVRLAASLYRA
jgi:photosystem I subunit 12